MEKFIDLKKKKHMKHVSMQEITLQDALVRVREQLNNLSRYFWRVFPTERGFNRKYEIGAYDQYKKVTKTVQAFYCRSSVMFHLVCKQPLTRAL